MYLKDNQSEGFFDSLFIVLKSNGMVMKSVSSSATGMVSHIPRSPMSGGKRNKGGSVNTSERHNAITADSNGRSTAV